jgi:hypothetical protein
MNGSWPLNQIDHKNTIPGDDRWSNLRELTYAQNKRNIVGPRAGNTTGILGVRRSGRKFRSIIVVDGARFDLGTYEDAISAGAAHALAKMLLHPEAEAFRSDLYGA